jgi:hypothetical protein
MAKVAYEIYEKEINGLTFLNAYYLEIRSGQDRVICDRKRNKLSHYVNI